jgi:molybdate transport system ATP-binding protein
LAGGVVSLDTTIAIGLGTLVLDVSLAVEGDEVVAVLGPNGAGKTTLLRVLAGLQPLDRGRLVLDGAVLDDPATGVFVPPERRSVGVAFQEPRLFPHLSALDNVAFGLRCRGADRATARAQALHWLARLGLTDRAGDPPSALSGGQAQRVALARALASAPGLLLLDEPLSALDVRTRADLRRELRRHLAEYDGVRILVTHDPLEAAALADRLVVLEAGRVVQDGTLAELAARPRSAWVAELVGVNLLRGRGDGARIALEGGGELAVADAGTGALLAVVHPRAVTLHRTRPDGSPRNVWRGRVERVEPAGTRARVSVAGTPSVVAEVTTAAVAELGLAPGVEVWVAVKATEIVSYPA